MQFFEKYSSNTYAGSGNQLYFNMNEKEVRTGRVFYKISVPGEFGYSILFSNIIDSTFAEGRESHCNLICDGWKIHSARVGVCKYINPEKELNNLVMSDDNSSDIKVGDFKEIKFDGKKTKTVMPGEFFSCDEIKLEFDEGEYLCLEITFSGKMIPYHEESMLPVFVNENGEWKFSTKMPFASMVGCDRKVKGRVAYLGDSITQGIGAAPNSYKHWNALLSQKIGADYAFWNLGLGFGRGGDAASDGAWLYKAKKNDTVFVCYGVNDINQGHSEEKIKSDFSAIADKLKAVGARVIFQTIPPYDYAEENIAKWKRINDYIKTEIKAKVDFVFDNAPYLGHGELLSLPKYGGHPNEDGSAVWTKALYEEVKDLF